MLAVKAYRDYARKYKGITNPNIVACATAHPAFDKAGQYLGVRVKHCLLPTHLTLSKIKKCPANSKTCKANVSAIARNIDSNTIAIVGSAPQVSIKAFFSQLIGI